MPLSDEDIREILRLVDESELDELRIEMEGLSLYVRRGGEAPVPVEAPTRARVDEAETPPPERVSEPVGPKPNEEPARTEPNGEPARPEPNAEPADGAATITAPMLGTFYRAEAPGAEPFVDLGARVEPDAVVCLIEVMKMMNSVQAGVSGTVVEICAENAELVEPGAPLFRVAPN